MILGASGGVGTVAVQIFKARGLHVIGVCSAKNRDLVLSLGADEVIDYKESDWGQLLSDKKVDTVFDFAPSGQASVECWDKAKLVLKRGGVFVTISGPDSEGRVSVCGAVALVCLMMWRNSFTQFKYYVVLKKSSRDKLEEMARLVNEGKLKAVVEKTYAFDDVPAAFAHLMSGRAVGKICISLA